MCEVEKYNTYIVYRIRLIGTTTHEKTQTKSGFFLCLINLNKNKDKNPGSEIFDDIMNSYI